MDEILFLFRVWFYTQSLFEKRSDIILNILHIFFSNSLNNYYYLLEIVFWAGKSKKLTTETQKKFDSAAIFPVKFKFKLLVDSNPTLQQYSTL